MFGTNIDFSPEQHMGYLLFQVYVRWDYFRLTDGAGSWHKLVVHVIEAGLRDDDDVSRRCIRLVTGLTVIAPHPECRVAIVCYNRDNETVSSHHQPIAVHCWT